MEDVKANVKVQMVMGELDPALKARACELAQEAIDGFHATNKGTPPPGYSPTSKAPLQSAPEIERKSAEPCNPAPKGDDGDGYTALGLIRNERQRQKSVEGWTDAHDDEHTDDGLACAAACYATPHDRREQHADDVPPFLWPWESDWWKPTPDDRIRELVKAGALIVAEIERLQRAGERTTLNTSVQSPAPIEQDAANVCDVTRGGFAELVGLYHRLEKRLDNEEQGRCAADEALRREVEALKEQQAKMLSQYEENFDAIEKQLDTTPAPAPKPAQRKDHT